MALHNTHFNRFLVMDGTSFSLSGLLPEEEVGRAPDGAKFLAFVTCPNNRWADLYHKFSF